MNIHLHIDRLVLDGIDLAYADRTPLAAAVEAELTRLLAEGGLAADLTGGAALASLHGASIQLGQNVPADQLGSRIAHAVYAGIGARESQGQKETTDERKSS